MLALPDVALEGLVLLVTVLLGVFLSLLVLVFFGGVAVGKRVEHGWW